MQLSTVKSHIGHTEHKKTLNSQSELNPCVDRNIGSTQPATNWAVKKLSFLLSVQ